MVAGVSSAGSGGRVRWGTFHLAAQLWEQVGMLELVSEGALLA